MSNILKIVVFVPKTHLKKVILAIGDAGAGRIGNYSHCTFTSSGIGRYKPLDGAKPFIGKVDEFESVKEEKLEFICNRSISKKVISEMRKAHPYEEVAFDIYELVSEKDL